MKDIKVEKKDLDESVSIDKCISNEKNKGMNLRCLKKLHYYSNK